MQAPAIVDAFMHSFLPIMIIAVVAITGGRYLQRKRLPGPPGLPLLGNIFQLGKFPWLKFTEWSQIYGPVFSINLAGRSVVILNDSAAVKELLDRRSNIYSSRPRFIVAGELLTGGLALPLMPYGDLWKRMRRAAHEGFSGRAADTHQPMQEQEAARFVRHIIEDPRNWDHHLRRTAVSTVLSAVYGWVPIGTDGDTLVDRINDVMHRIARASLPGAHLVELLPRMLHLPDWMAKWKREAKYDFKQNTQLFEGLLDDVRAKVIDGTAEPSFAVTLDGGKSNLDNTGMAWLAGMVFGAGAETTGAALSVFMLAMVLHPDVLNRAQAEIDAVVGRERLPNFNDRKHLPYIEAMVKEVHRWRPVTPLGVPRQTTEDDWYDGHFIPKGTLVLVNTWGINRDPAYFPDYDEFRPERYMDQHGQLADPVANTHNQGHLSYGAGRRICVGKELANQTLFMNFATLLWACDIQQAVGSDGMPKAPSRTECVDEGLVVRPAPFECTITARSSEIAELICAATDASVNHSRS